VREPAFFTAGYAQWPPAERAARLCATLREAGVALLIDIRHSPCPSALDPANTYGPRAWHLDAAGRGIVPLLREAGIAYRWLPALGNPQKNDPAMRILREHLADRDGGWPVHDGLAAALALVRDGRCCLLCACADYADCHRRVVAEALQKLCGARAAPHRDLTSRS
jgi:hypothetical protein